LMCNGTFEDKNPNEAMEYLDLLVENAQNWDITGTNETPSKTQPHTSSGGMHNLREDHNLQAKFTSFFFIKCKKCIDKKYQDKLAVQAGDQQYKGHT
jgi:hypothetical protein